WSNRVSSESTYVSCERSHNLRTVTLFSPFRGATPLYPKSGHVQRNDRCPLWAKSGPCSAANRIAIRSPRRPGQARTGPKSGHFECRRAVGPPSRGGRAPGLQRFFPSPGLLGALVDYLRRCSADRRRWVGHPQFIARECEWSRLLGPLQVWI